MLFKWVEQMNEKYSLHLFGLVEKRVEINK